MPPMPWTTVDAKVTNDNAVAMLTYLPLKHWWDTPMFIVFTARIRAQLLRTPGLIGFSMRARPIAKQYWTLSLWRDEAATGKYVHTMPHAMIMTQMKGKMGQTAFVSWPVEASVGPLDWKDALSRSTKSYH